MKPTFILMLTRDDRTIPDAFDYLPDILAAGVRHIGFKNIGLSSDEMARLTDAIRRGGAMSYLEVVSLDADSEANSARLALALGIDVLMGGTRPEIVLPMLKGRSIRYYPFPGQVIGHPSILTGNVEQIVSSATSMLALDGVDGVDLLAYRFAGDVPDLISRVCAAANDKPVIVAGSIDRVERIAEVTSCGVKGFTIGTAALNGAFGGNDLREELEIISEFVRNHGSRNGVS